MWYWVLWKNVYFFLFFWFFGIILGFLFIMFIVILSIFVFLLVVDLRLIVFLNFWKFRIFVLFIGFIFILLGIWNCELIIGCFGIDIFIEGIFFMLVLLIWIEFKLELKIWFIDLDWVLGVGFIIWFELKEGMLLVKLEGSYFLIIFDLVNENWGLFFFWIVGGEFRNLLICFIGFIGIFICFIVFWIVGFIDWFIVVIFWLVGFIGWFGIFMGWFRNLIGCFCNFMGCFCNFMGCLIRLIGGLLFNIFIGFGGVLIMFRRFCFFFLGFGGGLGGKSFLDGFGFISKDGLFVMFLKFFF